MVERKQEPVAWRVRIGDSNQWVYCESETDADFLGRRSGMTYEKQPLYSQPAGSADPEPVEQPVEQPVSCETCLDRAWCQQGRSCIHQGVSRELLLATISLTDAMRQKLLDENALLNKEIQALRRRYWPT